MPEPASVRIEGFDRQVAVVIGVNKYEHGIAALENAVADATRIAGLLATHHGYATHLLVDEAAEFGRLCAFFSAALPRLVTERSQLLIYFAGHGIAHEDEARRIDGFLLPRDARSSGRNWLPMAFLRRWLKGLPCHHLLLVLDCCFAGAFTSAEFREVEVQRRALFQEDYEYLLDRRSYYLLASAARDERAVDRLRLKQTADAAGAADGSPFVAAVVEAIGPEARADDNGDGVVTVSELGGYVRRRLRVHAALKQTPNLWPLDWHDAGEYMFLVGRPTFDPAPAPAETPNPYRGLSHFAVGDAHLFHGRDEIADRLARCAARQPMIVVLGPSGSGKSSLLHAGIAPRLPGHGLCAFGPVRPGAAPIQALATQLDLDREAPIVGQRCVIVDQLDELIAADDAERELLQLWLARIVAPPAAANDLAHRIAAIVSKLLPPVRELAEHVDRGLAALAVGSVIVALRSDSEPHFVRPRALGGMVSDLWTASRTLLLPMNREQLRACIVKPAAQQTFFFTEVERDGRHLVDALLDEVDQVPGALPLLSVALEGMFERCARTRRDRTIGWTEYPKDGGVSGALQDKANLLLAGGLGSGARDSSAQEAFRATLRRILLRMVTPRGNENVRRRVFLSELRWNELDEDRRASEALEALRREGLIVRDVDRFAARTDADQASTDEPGVFVQPAHDALLSAWPELQQWVSEERHGIVVQRDLGHAVELWLAHGRNHAQLWDDERIERLNELAKTPAGASARRRRRFEELWSLDYPIRRAPPYTYTAAETAFVRASLEARRGLRLKIAGAVVGAMSALAATTFLALGASARATRSADAATESARQEAEQRRLSDVRGLAYRARSQITARLDRALLLAAEAYEQRQPGETESTSALLDALLVSPHIERMYTLPSAGVSIAIDPMKKTIAVGLADGQLAFLDWKPYGGLALGHSREHAIAVTALAYDEHGELLVSGSGDGTIELWDVARHMALKAFPDLDPNSPVPDLVLTSERHPIADLRFDGDTVSALGIDGWHARWQLGSSRASTWQIPHGAGSAVAATLLGGGRFAMGLVGLTLWDAGRQRQAAKLEGANPILALASDPIGNVIVSGSLNRTVDVWNPHKPIKPTLLGVHDRRVTAVAVSPRDDLVASADEAGVVRVWSRDAPGDVKAVLIGQPGPVHGLQFTADAKHLVSTGGDLAIVWNVAIMQPLGETFDGVILPYAVGFASDQRSMIVSNSEGHVAVIDAAGAHDREPAMTAPRPLRTVVVSGTDHVAVATGDHRIAIEDARSGRTVSAVPIGGEVRELAASRHQVAAVATRGGEHWLWIADLVNGSLQAGRLFPVRSNISCIAVGGRGYVAIGRTDGTIEVRSGNADPWHLANRDRQLGMIASLALSERGDLVAGADEGRVSLWRPEDFSTGRVTDLAGLVARVDAVAIDDIEHHIAAGSQGRVLLWDSRSGQLLGDILVPPGADDSVSALGFLATGAQLAVAMSDAHVIRLEVDPRQWQRKACALANRELGADSLLPDNRSTLARPAFRSCAILNEELRRAR